MKRRQAKPQTLSILTIALRKAIWGTFQYATFPKVVGYSQREMYKKGRKATTVSPSPLRTIKYLGMQSMRDTGTRMGCSHHCLYPTRAPVCVIQYYKVL